MPVSRHALSRRLAITGLLSIGLSACAQSEATVSPFAEPTRADASALGKEPELLVVTTRRSLGARQPYFGSDRGSLTFAEVRLSPPGRGISGKAVKDADDHARAAKAKRSKRAELGRVDKRDSQIN